MTERAEAGVIRDVVAGHEFRSWSTSRRTPRGGLTDHHAGCTCDQAIEFDWFERHAQHLAHLHRAIFEAGRAFGPTP